MVLFFLVLAFLTQTAQCLNSCWSSGVEVCSASAVYWTMEVDDCPELANCNCSVKLASIYCTNLTYVPNFEELANPSSYKTLRITNSQINRITSSASFLPLTQLGTLEITSSGVTNIAPDVFYDLCKSGRRSLDRLDLQRNRLTSVPSGLEHCTFFSEICLGANDISSSGLGLNKFAHMGRLAYLDLSENRNLSIIPAESLKFGSGVLKAVNLENNGIRRIDSDSGISDVCHADISSPPSFCLSVGNNIFCDCSLFWICDYIGSCVQSNGFVCSSDSKAVSDYCKNDNCSKNLGLQLGLGIGISLGVLILIALIPFLFWIWKTRRASETSSIVYHNKIISDYGSRDNAIVLSCYTARSLGGCSMNEDYGQIFCSQLTKVPDFRSFVNDSLIENFRILVIRDSFLGDIDFSVTPLSYLRALTNLIIENNEILSISYFSDVCKIPLLSVLSMQSNGLKEIPSGISSCVELTSVEFRNNSISPSGLGIKRFSTMRRLRYLDLSENEELIFLGQFSLEVNSGDLIFINLNFCQLQSIDIFSGISGACENAKTSGKRVTVYLSRGNYPLRCNNNLLWICNYLDTCTDVDFPLSHCIAASGKTTDIITFCEMNVISIN
ncbi:leucine-rich repeat protein soc-2 homolog isoform X1 [Oscarella lobularis]|uniref:leucine-rich repeat protein soc-2 homolog isoform X1 n=1 Tax=Oscarella lobularis TaxID=121494 RepID=UPI003313FA35